MTEAIYALLACPQTGQPLRRLEPEALRALNDALASRSDGDPEQADLEGALATEDGARIYPIRAGLAFLLPEDALPV